MSGLSPKNNLLHVFNHKIPERIPNVKKDIATIMPAELAERAPGDGSPAQMLGGTGVDWFGVHWVFEPVVGASMVDPKYPPVLEDVTKWKSLVKFPDLDAIDWAAAAERDLKNYNPDKALFITLLNGMFERLHSLMGMTEACCALLLEPEAVYEFFGAVAEHKIKLIGKLITHYPVDFIELHDDWGHKANSFFAPELWSKLVGPHVRRITTFARENCIHLRFHSCGKVDNLIPMMVEAGIEHWSSVQALNDVEGIIRNFGDRLTLTGGMDTDVLKDMGLPKDRIENIVNDRIDNLCRGGAFLPSASSQVPLVQAAIDKALEARTDFFKNQENCKLPL